MPRRATTEWRIVGCVLDHERSSFDPAGPDEIAGHRAPLVEHSRAAFLTSSTVTARMRSGHVLTFSRSARWRATRRTSAPASSGCPGHRSRRRSAGCGRAPALPGSRLFDRRSASTASIASSTCGRLRSGLRRSRRRRAGSRRARCRSSWRRRSPRCRCPPPAPDTAGCWRRVPGCAPRCRSPRPRRRGRGVGRGEIVAAQARLADARVGEVTVRGASCFGSCGRTPRRHLGDARRPCRRSPRRASSPPRA